MKKHEKQIIPIFFAVDDRYSPYLCVALRSLIDNSTSKYDYRVFVLIEELSDENKELIGNMATENTSIEFVSVSDKLREICAKLHLRDYYTKATYYTTTFTLFQGVLTKNMIIHKNLHFGATFHAKPLVFSKNMQTKNRQTLRHIRQTPHLFERVRSPTPSGLRRTR